MNINTFRKGPEMSKMRHHPKSDDTTLPAGGGARRQHPGASPPPTETQGGVPGNHPGVELRANLKSISHRCQQILVAFVFELA